VQARISHDPDVRPPVCLSVFPFVKRVDCDKREDVLSRFLIPDERTFILIFRHDEMVCGDDLFYLKCWAKLTPFLQKGRFSIDIRS